MRHRWIGVVVGVVVGLLGLAGQAAGDVLIAPERGPHRTRSIEVGEYVRLKCWYRPYGEPGRSVRVTVTRKGKRVARTRVRCAREWHRFRVHRARRSGRYVMHLRGAGFRNYRIVTRVRR